MKTKFKVPKTRVCRGCDKRKKITAFHNQSPALKWRPNYRWDCKKCHSIKSTRAYHQRTTKKERRLYMLKYMRNYNGTEKSQYRIAA